MRLVFAVAIVVPDRLGSGDALHSEVEVSEIGLSGVAGGLRVRPEWGAKLGKERRKHGLPGLG